MRRKNIPLGMIQPKETPQLCRPAILPSRKPLKHASQLDLQKGQKGNKKVDLSLLLISIDKAIIISDDVVSEPNVITAQHQNLVEKTRQKHQKVGPPDFSASAYSLKVAERS
jgi:hypothetical protein